MARRMLEEVEMIGAQRVNEADGQAAQPPAAIDHPVLARAATSKTLKASLPPKEM